MIDIINNKSKMLGDDLKQEIKSGSRLRIAASCFSIYGLLSAGKNKRFRKEK